MQKKRVRVYIDAANLILSARTHEIVYDIAALCEYFVYKYGATSCVYFTGRVSSLATEYVALEQLGVAIVYKEIYSEYAKTKANCDVEIAHHITRDIERTLVDEVILVSGDGDFAALLDYAHEELGTVRLFAIHRDRTSRLLRSRTYLGAVWLSDVCEKIMQRKGSARIKVPAERLFGTYSIPTEGGVSSVSVDSDSVQ